MAWDPLRLITVNGLALQNEKVVAIRLNGMLQTEEGTDIWNGTGDRGDAAMIAYGASRYALARTYRKQAQTLRKAIDTYFSASPNVRQAPSMPCSLPACGPKTAS